MKDRYKITIEYGRVVRVPFLGPDATHKVYKRETYLYGKGKEFENSKQALDVLTEKVLTQKNQCTDIHITVWNGYSGIVFTVYETQNKFETNFEKEIPEKYLGFLS